MEARFSGSIKRVQLDNQMIDATQPVVLAPASVAHAHSKTAQALTGVDSALIEFGIARSFAYSVLGGRDQVPAADRPPSARASCASPEECGGPDLEASAMSNPQQRSDVCLWRGDHR